MSQGARFQLFGFPVTIRPGFVVIIALIWGTLKITRAIEKRVAYRGRPTDAETLKAEFLRAVNDIADRHDAEQLGAREGHHELTGVMRRFVRRTTGHDVTSQDLATLLADPRTRPVGTLIAAVTRLARRLK